MLLCTGILVLFLPDTFHCGRYFNLWGPFAILKLIPFSSIALQRLLRSSDLRKEGHEITSWPILAILITFPITPHLSPTRLLQPPKLVTLHKMPPSVNPFSSFLQEPIIEVEKWVFWQLLALVLIHHVLLLKLSFVQFTRRFSN